MHWGRAPGRFQPGLESVERLREWESLWLVLHVLVTVDEPTLQSFMS